MRNLVLSLLCLVGASWVSSCKADRPLVNANPVSMEPATELLNLGDKLFRQSKYKEARQAYARAVVALGPDSAYVEACAQVARTESLLSNIENGRPWLELAAVRASREEPLGWSRLQMVIGIFERDAGHGDEAVARFKDLYSYNIDNGLYERAIDVAHHVVLASEELEEQMEWTRRGIEAAEAGGLQGWLAVLWNNKGAALEEQGRWEDACVAYGRARRYHYETGNKQRMLIADWALARAERRTGLLTVARSRSRAAFAQALDRYSLEASPTNAEWVGYLRWELGELDALDGHEELAIAGLRSARNSLMEAKINTWGEFGIAELARLDARIEELDPTEMVVPQAEPEAAAPVPAAEELPLEAEKTSEKPQSDPEGK
ncbi:MAG: tetratricopeptide (TPR) repeat protein [Planctomycetota bacterium]|jgi:tetratricopeptide (TPR) repeat protein